MYYKLQRKEGFRSAHSTIAFYICYFCVQTITNYTQVRLHHQC